MKWLLLVCNLASSIFAYDYCLAFVYIGTSLPKHMRTAVEQARLFNADTPIFILGNIDAIQLLDWSDLEIILVPIESLPISQSHRKYIKSTQATGFWRYALERFFVLDNFIQEYGLSNVFHIENDVMLYCSLSEKLPQFKKSYPNMLATAFDCDQRAIPSFVYISNPSTSGLLANFIQENDCLNMTDMEMLNLFKNTYYQARGSALPILIPAYADDYPLINIFKNISNDPGFFSNHLDDLGMIFDAAALGQFLGGIDPILGESKSGFLGEASIFLPMHFVFDWKKDEKERWVPYISYNGIVYPIANLHIHSKKLNLFSSANIKMPDLPTKFYSSLPYDHIQAKRNQ